MQQSCGVRISQAALLTVAQKVSYSLLPLWPHAASIQHTCSDTSHCLLGMVGALVVVPPPEPGFCNCSPKPAARPVRLARACWNPRRHQAS
ncbi:hypothetical protein K461DRAFT_150673 [Myriangium duriaei CBS 260.36]|uniref:Uncharacterized protein n=1 Tax=Myriangium duriaei CBS 260.36 TaxID=1168546 RepID=A0A9P4IZB2_9PEZI|nr:hypothetical protein K461DRAFT_150673 [Myriangium duriaei CBS 260.36]